jgi:hypothetical protein
MATKKRTAPKKTTRSRSKSSDMPSFKIVKDTIPFTSTKFTRQTFYWIILVGLIVFLQLWIIKLQTDVGNLTNTLLTIQQDREQN